jgi:Uma2 family endonuclease
MNLIPKSSRRTFGDFLALVNDGEKADLIDGVVYKASPDNVRADQVFGWLHALLTFFVAARDLGRVYGSRRAFRLDDLGGPEPDGAFVRKDRLGQNQWGFFDGPPDLAVEIVSPDSAERDYKQKRKQYQKARVPEYWIVAPEQEQMTLLHLGKKGKYQVTVRKRGFVRSRAVKGFWLRAEWLWQDNLPDPNAVLKEILGGQP